MLSQERKRTKKHHLLEQVIEFRNRPTNYNESQNKKIKYENNRTNGSYQPNLTESIYLDVYFFQEHLYLTKLMITITKFIQMKGNVHFLGVLMVLTV